MYVFEASISEITSPPSTLLDLLAYDNIFSQSFLVRGKIDDIKKPHYLFFIKVTVRKNDGVMKDEVSSPLRFHY